MKSCRRLNGWPPVQSRTSSRPEKLGSCVSIANCTTASGRKYVYPYFRPLAVVQFAMDTHDPSFSGRLDVRDWTGGQPFSRLQDFIDYFRNIAVNESYPLDGCNQGFTSCKYD